MAGDRRRSAARLQSQLLTRPAAGSPEAVVERLLAVQAQDARGFRLALRSRSTGLAASDVDASLDAARLVVSTLNRGTLHLVRAQDFWDLHALTTPQLRTSNGRRLCEEGVDPEQAVTGIDVLARALASGPQTRTQLRSALEAAGVPTARQAFAHVILAATLEGLLVRGPMRGSEQAFVDPSTWIGPRPGSTDRELQLVGLAVGYLRGHGPAGPHDLARWAGISLGQARRAFAGVADQSEAFGDRSEVVLRGPDSATGDEIPAPRLLGAFDPVLLGWSDRDDVIGAHRGIVTANGLFRSFALVQGRAVATWSYARGSVTLTALEPIPQTAQRALAADADEVVRFLSS